MAAAVRGNTIGTRLMVLFHISLLNPANTAWEGCNARRRPSGGTVCQLRCSCQQRQRASGGDLGLAGVLEGFQTPAVPPSCPHAGLRGKERLLQALALALLLLWKLLRIQASHTYVCQVGHGPEHPTAMMKHVEKAALCSSLTNSPHVPQYSTHAEGERV